MIAFAKKQADGAPTNGAPDWHARFLAMLPTIRCHARRAFRSLPPQARSDAVDEVVANSLAAFARLVELDRAELAYPTPLAAYAVKRVRAGRRVGNPRDTRDVMSPCARLRGEVTINRLDQFDPTENCWQEVLVEDKRATPADTAACRIDFADWLQTLPGRHRRIAKVLATNESTCAAAERFGVSPGRISQIRRELHAAWQLFQGEVIDGWADGRGLSASGLA